MAGKGKNEKSTVIANGSNKDELIAGSLFAEQIDAKPGDDVVGGGGGDDWVKGGPGDDVVDGGSGSDRVDGGAFDDALIYTVGENTGSFDYYDGGSGVDSLTLNMTRDEWMRDDVQADIAAFLVFLENNMAGKSGQANGERFTFDSLGLEVRKIEIFKVVVDGVELDPRDEIVVAHDDHETSATEHSLVLGNVTSNDEVPDLVRITEVINGPQYGSLQLDGNGTFVYDPGNHFDYLAQGESSQVDFTYRVLDADHDTDTATVRITITGTNDAPVALADNAETSENDGVVIDVLANDTDVDLSDTHTLDTIEITSGAGSAAIVDNRLQWSPGADYDHLAVGESATVQIAYAQSDNFGASAASTVEVLVNGVNDAPEVAAIVSAMNEDAAVFSIDLLGTSSDVDGSDVLAAVNLEQMGGRAITNEQSDSVFSFDPGQFNDLAVGESEVLSFRYDVSDGHVLVENTLTVTVEGRNDAPVAFVDHGSATENTTQTIDVLANDTDVDVSDTHTVDNVRIVSGSGTASVTANQVQWDPGTDYDWLALGEASTVSLEYDQSDNHGATATAAIELEVVGTNDIPVVAGIARTVAEDDAAIQIDLLETASDADASDTLGARNLTQVAGRDVPMTLTGSLIALDPGLFNDLAQGQSETLIFQYNVHDPHVEVDNTVTVIVEGLNDAPIVSAPLSSAASEQDAVYDIDLLSGATDVDSGAVLAVANLVETTGLGGWSWSGNSLLIDPDHFDALNNGDVATLEFQFQIVDEHGAFVDQVMNVNIEGFTDAPSIAVSTAAGQRVNEVQLTVTTEPADQERVSLSFSNLPAGAIVLDAGLNDVTSGIKDAAGTNIYTVVLPDTENADFDLEVIATGVADDGAFMGASSALVDVGYAATNHVANLTFSADNQGIWASGDAPMVEWHQYLPIVGGIARVWDDATESWVDTNTGMWNSGEFVLIDAGVNTDDIIELALAIPREALHAALVTFNAAKTLFDGAVKALNDAIQAATTIFNDAVNVAKDVFDDAVSWTQETATSIAWATYYAAVDAAELAREGTITLFGWLGQWVIDEAWNTYNWAVGVAADARDIALDAAQWTIERAKEAAQAVYDAAVDAAAWVRDTAIDVAQAAYDVAQGVYDVAKGVYDHAVAAFQQTENELKSAIDGGAELSISANLFAEVGAQIDFVLDSGSVDAELSYSLDATEQYNKTTDMLVITPQATNLTTGEAVAFETVSPNAAFKVVLVYEVGANLNMFLDGELTVLGTQLLDLSPGSEGLNLMTTLSTGGFEQQLDIVRTDGGPAEIGEFQGVNAGELTLIDFDSTELSPFTVPFLTKLSKDILTVQLAFPTVETEGTAAAYDPAMFDEGLFLSLDFGELVGTLLNHVNARIDISDEIKQELGLPGLEDSSGIDDAVAQAAQAFLSQILDSLDLQSSGTPIFVIDATDETSSEFALANLWPNQVITDTLSPETASFGFYVGYGESQDVVNVSIDIDQLVAFIVNKVVEAIINLATQGKTVTVLEALPDINPLNLKFGIDEILDAFQMEAASEQVKQFFDLKVSFEAADLDVDSGIHFSQEFTLSVDDMSYLVTLEDGAQYAFAASESDSIVIDDASNHDANGDGTVEYSMQVVPTAMFSNDTEIGVTLGYTLDFLKSALKADLKIPIGSVVSIPGLSSLKVPFADIAFGPLLRVQGDLDVAAADVFESRFEFDLGSAITESAVTVIDDILNGTADDDVIESREGNDVLTGGAGDDVFVFADGSGFDTITDFTAGAGSDDVLDLVAISNINTFEELQLASVSDGQGNTLIHLGDGNTIKLLGVDPEDLHKDDFIGG